MKDIFFWLTIIVTLFCGAYMVTAFFDFTTQPVTVQEYVDPIKIILGLFGILICVHGYKKYKDL